MPNFLDNQIQSLIAFIISLPVGYGIGIFKKKVLDTRKIRRIWSFLSPKNLYICLSTTITYTGEHKRPSTGMGQVWALSDIITSLSKAYPNIDLKKIIHSQENVKNILDNDLILLGGPKTNEMTKYFFEKFKYRNRVSQALDSSIFWSETAQSYRGDIKNGKVEKDYGLIIKVDNPTSSKKRSKVILFSGAHTYGTTAAAKYYSECIIHEKQIDKYENFAILVSCDVINEFVSNVKFFGKIEF